MMEAHGQFPHAGTVIHEESRIVESISQANNVCNSVFILIPPLTTKVSAMTEPATIPGTTIFDGKEAVKGYALNRMCFSFNQAENRAAFLADEDAYCARYGLTPEQRAAIKSRQVLELIAAGGNIYYLAKFAGIFGMNVQDIGAQQTGMPLAVFKARLLEAGK